MTTPEVTIVVCTRGERSLWLAEALRSIRSQTVPCRTLIVVNEPEGRGRDEKVMTVAAVAGESARVPFELRVGPGENHAQGANVALEDLGSARYVGFLDDDDVIYEGHVAKLVEALGRYPEAGVAYSDARLWHCSASNVPESAGPSFEGPFTLEQLRRDNVRPMHSFLFRASALAGVRIEPSHALSDWSLSLSLAWRGAHFVHAPGITSEYRVRAGRTESTNTPRATVQDGTVVVREFWRRKFEERAAS